MVLHNNIMVDLVNGKADIDFSKVGDSYQINFSVQPKLPNGVYTYEMDVVLTTSRGYNIMLWGDCGGSGYNKVAQNDAQGGYFHRGTGKRTRIKAHF